MGPPLAADVRHPAAHAQGVRIQMDGVDRFAAVVSDFERWIVDGVDEGADAAREALTQLLRLYGHGLELPAAWSDDLASETEVERLTELEWRKAAKGCQRLPLDAYSDIFN